jgi:DNA primase
MSISKIPDGIQREVYVQECARIMDISERVLFSELAQIIAKGVQEINKVSRQQNNAQQDPNAPPPEYFLAQEQAQMGVVKGGIVSLAKIDEISKFEKEIIKILLLHGNKEGEFIEEIESEDEEGKALLTSRKYNNNVSAEIYVHLQDDEMEFTNTIFQEIYTEIIHQLNQSEKLEINALVNHQNKEIASTVTSILMDEDEEKYQLSDWEGQNIEVKMALLSKQVNDVVFNLRRVLIGKKIEELIKEATGEIAIDLETVKGYTSLRIRLFEKLNRVV